MDHIHAVFMEARGFTVSSNYKTPCRWWVPNPSPLEKQPVLFDPQCAHDLTQSSVITVPGDLMSSSGLLASVGNRYKGGA